MTTLRAIPPKPARLSPKLRQAIDLRIRRGMTIKDACEEAGLSCAGYHKAMKRPAVQDHYRQEQAAYVAEVEASRASYKARAFEVALDLMLNAKSETIRARMAEFLASDGKTGNSVNVHVDARQSSGYEYVRPGQKVVEIIADDGSAASIGKDGQSGAE